MSDCPAGGRGALTLMCCWICTISYLLHCSHTPSMGSFMCVYWFSKCIRCCLYASLNSKNEICVLITLFFFLNIKKENSYIASVNSVFPSSLTIDINWAKLDNNEEHFCQLSGLTPTQSCLVGNLKGVCVMHAGMVFWLSCVFITRKVFFSPIIMHPF